MSQELASRFSPAITDDLGDRDLAVVVADAARHATEELEGPAVIFLKRLGAFLGKHLTEDRVAVGQRDHKESGLLRLAV